MLIGEIIGALGQLTLVLVIGSIAWAFFGRRKAAWGHWLGLSSPPSGWWKGALLIIFVLALIKLPLFTLTPMIALTSGEGTVGGQLAGLGWGPDLMATILVMALVKTALAEEILFRGLIAKRLIGWLGFGAGNLVQAGLFGSVHLLIFFTSGAPPLSLPSIAAFFLLPTIAGWLMGYANERWGGGTIWPGWMIHGLGNAIAYSLFASL